MLSYVSTWFGRWNSTLRILRLSVFLIACFIAATLVARADTLDFAVTMNQQNGISVFPLGTVFTGSAHYAGTWSLSADGTPPAIDAFAFDYPYAPNSSVDYRALLTFRLYDGVDGYPYLFVVYLDPAVPNGSFSILRDTFSLFNPFDITPNSFRYTP